MTHYNSPNLELRRSNSEALRRAASTRNCNPRPQALLREGHGQVSKADRGKRAFRTVTTYIATNPFASSAFAPTDVPERRSCPAICRYAPGRRLRTRQNATISHGKRKVRSHKSRGLAQAMSSTNSRSGPNQLAMVKGHEHFPAHTVLDRRNCARAAESILAKPGPSKFDF
jgi:hypothetical protein